MSRRPGAPEPTLGQPAGVMFGLDAGVPSRLGHLPSRLTVGVLVAIMLVVCTIAGFAMWDAHRSTGDRAEEGLLNLSLSLQRSLERDLLQTDILLQAIARNVDKVESPDVAEGEIKRWRESMESGLRSITVVGEGGTILLSDPSGKMGSTTEFTASLEAHRSNSSLGFHAGEVARSRKSGALRLTVSRRFLDREGHFAGIVAGNIRLDHFRRNFSDFRLGEGGTVTLLTLDGRLVAASNMQDRNAGMDLSHSPVMQRVRDLGPGVFKAPSVVDGRKRLYVMTRLEGMPFYLVVGRLTRDIYADLKQRIMVSVAVLLMLLALLAILTVALHRELGRRHRAEAEAWRNAKVVSLAAAELELVTGNLDDLILKIDWDGTRRFVSQASERLLGYTPSELLLQNSLAFVHPEDAPDLRRQLRALESGELDAAQANYRVQHRNGSWRHVEARCRPLPDESGAIVAVRDVSTRIALEEELRQAQKMEGIGQLTAGVAHDFNNMLQGQIAGLELLLDRVDNDPEAARLAERAIQSAEVGARLTHSLLAFARKQVLRPEPVDLARLFDELVGLLSRTLGPSIVLDVLIEPDLPPPVADRALLAAALLNLCLNARDAMRGKAGRIRLHASRTGEGRTGEGRTGEGRTGEGRAGEGRAGEGRTADGSAGAMIGISVSDEGCGMTPEVLSRVCEPFFTTKQLGEGSGLGLSMVQGFARQSGGELLLDSRPGQGTRALICLPQAKQAVVLREASPRHPAAGVADGRRVLLVDDDAFVRANLVQALQVAGYDASGAADGEEAVALLRAGPAFDVMVTDYGMPGMTGVELIRLARARHPKLGVLLITGYVDIRQLDGVPDHVVILHKPFRLDELLTDLARLHAPRLLSA